MEKPLKFMNVLPYILVRVNELAKEYHLKMNETKIVQLIVTFGDQRERLITLVLWPKNSSGNGSKSILFWDFCTLFCHFNYHFSHLCFISYSS